MPPGLRMRTQELAVVARQNMPQMRAFPKSGFMSIYKHIGTRQLGFTDITNIPGERFFSPVFLGRALPGVVPFFLYRES
jgi:hypothetical protein